MSKIKSQERSSLKAASIKNMPWKRYFNNFQRIEFDVIVSNMFIAM